MTVNNLTRYETGFNKAFAEASRELNRSTLWSQLALVGSRIPTAKGVEDYRWLGALPQFSRWVGERKIDTLKDYHYFLENHVFQAAVQIDSDDLADDTFNLYRDQVAALPLGVENQWGELVDELLKNGTSAKAFDGVAFFASASGERKFTNLLTGTISAGSPTLDQVKADVSKVRSAMAQFKDANGKALGIVPDTFVVHPDLEILFKQLFRSTADVSSNKNAGVFNPFEGMGRVVVDPGLSDVNDFYALSTAGWAVGPLIRQEREAVRTELFDDHFTNRRFIFGAEFRGNAGYGFPQLAAKVVSSVA